MPVTIGPETGAREADANSYVTLDEQTAFLETHPFGAATLALDADTISKGMIQSFRVLNSAADWKGVRVAWDQEGEFPRTGIEPVPNNKIPKAIKLAQMELLRFVLATDRDTANDIAPIKRVKVDVIEREFQDGGKRDLVPEVVQRLIAPFVRSMADDAAAGGGATSSYVLAGRA